ncbi:aspartyl protease family protein At5g10770-like [Triticum aestivum]|uniref:aspartyl protease family protein At5g10770-like n=1 Tax=Triticum aestivum TaxID=4565 RepID=UPI001D00F31D|nr:aspartyl protease family protein At5g10770-like [Triticum aestivum]
MASPHLFLCILLVVFGSYLSTISAAGDAHFRHKMSAPPPHPQYDTRMFLSVTPRPNRAGAAVPLVHRHGPCAKSPSTDKPSSFAEALHRSRVRADYIMSRALRGRGTTTTMEGKVSIPAHLGTSVDSQEYVVTLGLGTPAVEQVLLMDTGSDLSWVQCAPCNSTDCYPQKDPLFDPRKSSTYAPIPCGSNVCKSLQSNHLNNGCSMNGNGTQSQCGYRVEYGGGLKTRGVYSNEALTLAPGEVVKDFHFGCAYKQRGADDKSDGLLGLGGAPQSLPVQTSALYGGSFSYCLPPVSSGTGFLALGAPSNTSDFSFTPMTDFMDDGTSYLVKLTGISVGGKQLRIPRKVFEGGLIVDCGNIISHLPSTPYAKLRSAFRAAMAAYPLIPSDDDDTCYNFTGYSDVTVPKVALTFTGGVTVDLDVPNGVLLDGCLAFTESGSDGYVGFLGNVQMRTLEMLYDARGGGLGFRAGAC